MRVTAVVIARDDARRLERALLSVKPLVHDLFVLDLGSVDDTAERARRCGARVEVATWSDDRAAVRNQAVALAGGDWHVILEPGEWVADGAGLAQLAALPADGIGLVEVVPAAAARGQAPTALEPRLLPGVVRWAGGHREEPIAPGLPAWRSDVVFTSDVEEPAGWRRDRALVEAALLQGIGIGRLDVRTLVDLAELRRAQGHLDEATALYRDALSAAEPDDPDRHAFVTATLDMLRQARRFREAVALMDAEMRHWRDSPDFAYIIGELFFDLLLAEPADTVQLATLADTSWRRALEIGERPDLPGAMTGRGSFLAAQALATLHLVLGHESEAEHWWETADRLRLAPPGGSARLLG